MNKSEQRAPLYPEMGRRRLAAPSWVLPGTLAENCRFLAGKVDEAGLLFLESAASLAYTRQDIPEDLAGLSLSWHVHLPLDLPWARDEGRAAAETALRLMDRVSFLGVERAVLHPPAANGPEGDAAGRRLGNFIRRWEKAGREARHILLENVRENDLTGMASGIRDSGAGLCVDFGHMLVYGQYERLLAALPGLGPVGMIHWSAPGGAGDGHKELPRLSQAERALARGLCALAPPDAVMMLEIFTWRGVRASIPPLMEWLAGR